MSLQTIFATIVKGLTLSFIFLGITQSNAELSIEEMKGLHNLVHEKHQDISLVQAYAAIYQEQLKNLRFNGYYGKERKPIHCMKQIRANENDCPLNYRASLLQRLFPSRDLANFVPNQLGEAQDFIGKHLGIKEVAFIINHKKKLGDKTDKETWINSLTFQLMSSIYPETTKKALRLDKNTQKSILSADRLAEEFHNWENCSTSELMPFQNIKHLVNWNPKY